MALLSNNFGNFSGKLGNVVLRTRNGKTYIASLPEKYTLSYSEKAVKCREHFALIAKLSKAIAVNFVLNHFWSTSEYPGESVRNKIEKQNYHVVENNDLSTLQLFKSPDMFNISLKEISFDGSAINVTINPLALTCEGAVVSPLKTPLISAQGFIFLYNPEGTKDKFKFIPVSSRDESTSLNEEITFKFIIKGIDAKQMAYAPEKKLLFNLSLKEPTGKPARCSGTIYYIFG